MKFTKNGDYSIPENGMARAHGNFSSRERANAIADGTNRIGSRS